MTLGPLKASKCTLNEGIMVKNYLLILPSIMGTWSWHEVALNIFLGGKMISKMYISWSKSLLQSLRYIFILVVRLLGVSVLQASGRNISSERHLVADVWWCVISSCWRTWYIAVGGKIAKIFYLQFHQYIQIGFSGDNLFGVDMKMIDAIVLFFMSFEVMAGLLDTVFEVY